MSISVYRIVLIADQYDPTELIDALILAGVKPDDIHISSNQVSSELMRRNIHFDVPSGVIDVKSYSPRG